MRITHFTLPALSVRPGRGFGCVRSLTGGAGNCVPGSSLMGRVEPVFAVLFDGGRRRLIQIGKGTRVGVGPPLACRHLLNDLFARVTLTAKSNRNHSWVNG